MNVIKTAFFYLILLILPTVTHGETWTVATLEWPPFTCSRCPENGAAIKALREALKKENVKVEFVFLSWTDAIEVASSERHAGYFPAWIESVRPGFFPSEALFRSPIGFVESRERPLHWKKLSDLRGKVIGVTEDYGNTEEFNRLVEEGVIKVEVVKSDDTNIRKVALGKLDGALIDLNNARYFLSVTMKNLSGRVQINSKEVQNKELYIAFNSHSKKKAETLKKALKGINYQQIVTDYLKKYTRP